MALIYLSDREFPIEVEESYDEICDMVYHNKWVNVIKIPNHYMSERMSIADRTILINTKYIVEVRSSKNLYCHWRKSRWHNHLWQTCIGERYFEKVPEKCPYCQNKIRKEIE